MAAIPVMVVLGATAAGKSTLALALARALGGEIISADAMAVYQGMDIGTAKPSAEERAGVPHHLISCFAPEERCDVSRWLALADAAVGDIHGRARRVVVAGGSPLYAKALLEGLSAGAPRDEAVRAELNARYQRDGAPAMFAELARIDPAYAAVHHANDQKRVVRALEVHRLTGRPYSSFHTTDGVRREGLRALLIGLEWPRAVLHRRIAERARLMFAAGLVEEVRALAPRLSSEARQAVGYKEVLGLLAGDYGEAQALELVTRNSRRLAKHQLTWYRGWPDIRWLPGDDPALVARATAMAGEFLAGA
jgi:tRNA dimethylallyltransferase